MNRVLMTIRPRKASGGKRSSAAARTADAVLMLVLGGKLNTKLLGAEEVIGFTARR